MSAARRCTPFRFALKGRISEATYNAIWLQLQEKNGKIQAVVSREAAGGFMSRRFSISQSLRSSIPIRCSI
jgi:hypothetical protein